MFLSSLGYKLLDGRKLAIGALGFSSIHSMRKHAATCDDETLVVFLTGCGERADDLAFLAKSDGSRTVPMHEELPAEGHS